MSGFKETAVYQPQMLMWLVERVFTYKGVERKVSMHVPRVSVVASQYMSPPVDDETEADKEHRFQLIARTIAAPYLEDQFSTLRSGWEPPI